MTETNVVKLSQPETFLDPLTEVLRRGARVLLAQAVESEVAAFLDSHAEQRTEDGRRRLVRRPLQAASCFGRSRMPASAWAGASTQ
ncbi:MAG: hypothetical protein ACFCUQ_21095 [Kiloniellales bacterium]